MLASLNAEVAQGRPSPSYVAHLHIASAVIGLDEVHQTVIKKALQAATRGRDEQPLDRVGYRSGMLAAMLAVAPGDEAVLDAVRWFDAAVGEIWSELVNLWRMNPEAVTTYVQYLGELLASHEVGPLSPARARILELARVIPGCLDGMGRFAEPRVWEENWDELVAVVFRAAMGKPDRLESRLDALGFWTAWLHEHPWGPVHDDLAFLRDFTLLSVA